MKYEVKVKQDTDFNKPRKEILTKVFDTEQDARNYMSELKSILDAAFCILYEETPTYISFNNGDAFIDIFLGVHKD